MAKNSAALFQFMCCIPGCRAAAGRRSPRPARMAVAFEDDRPGPGEDDGEGVGPEGQGHEQHRGQHRARHFRRCGDADGCPLVQRVPPLHREIDDRHVDAADDRQQRPGPVGAARVVDRRDQGEEAGVEEEQDQLRGQARVPDPPGAPGRLAPERAGPEGEEGEHRPGRRDRPRRHRGQPGVEGPADRRPERHHQVEQHRHPGRGDVDEDDPVRRRPGSRRSARRRSRSTGPTAASTAKAAQHQGISAPARP